jgi:hypothetical protein
MSTTEKQHETRTEHIVHSFERTLYNMFANTKQFPLEDQQETEETVTPPLNPHGTFPSHLIK